MKDRIFKILRSPDTKALQVVSMLNLIIIEPLNAEELYELLHISINKKRSHQEYVIKFLKPWLDKFLLINDQDISNDFLLMTIEHIVQVGYFDLKFIQKYKDKVIEHLDHFNPDQLIEGLYSSTRILPYDKLCITNNIDEYREFVGSYINKLSCLLASIETAELLSKSISAASKLQFYDEVFLNNWVDKVVSIINVFSSSDLTKSINAVANLGFYNDLFINSWLDQAHNIESTSRNIISSSFSLAMLSLHQDIRESTKSRITDYVRESISALKLDEIIFKSEKQQILTIIEYLSLKEDDIGLDDLLAHKWKALIKRESLGDVTISREQSKIYNFVDLYLKQQISYDIEVNKEVWIGSWSGPVDVLIKFLYAPESKWLVVAFDGPFHYRLDNPSAQNFKTVINSKIIEKHDFDIIRLSYFDDVAENRNNIMRCFPVIEVSDASEATDIVATSGSAEPPIILAAKSKKSSTAVKKKTKITLPKESKDIDGILAGFRENDLKAILEDSTPKGYKNLVTYLINNLNNIEIVRNIFNNQNFLSNLNSKTLLQVARLAVSEVHKKTKELSEKLYKPNDHRLDELESVRTLKLAEYSKSAESELIKIKQQHAASCAVEYRKSIDMPKIIQNNQELLQKIEICEFIYYFIRSISDSVSGLNEFEVEFISLIDLTIKLKKNNFFVLSEEANNRYFIADLMKIDQLVNNIKVLHLSPSNQLFIAVEYNNLPLIKYILNIHKELDINTIKNKINLTLLHVACSFNHRAIIEYLLYEKKIDPNIMNGNNTPLATFVGMVVSLYSALNDDEKEDCLDIIRILIEAGANTNVYFNGKHIIAYAIEHGIVAIVMDIIQKNELDLSKSLDPAQPFLKPINFATMYLDDHKEKDDVLVYALIFKLIEDHLTIKARNSFPMLEAEAKEGDASETVEIVGIAETAEIIETAETASSSDLVLDSALPSSNKGGFLIEAGGLSFMQADDDNGIEWPFSGLELVMPKITVHCVAQEAQPKTLELGMLHGFFIGKFIISPGINLVSDIINKENADKAILSYWTEQISMSSFGSFIVAHKVAVIANDFGVHPVVRDVYMQLGYSFFSRDLATKEFNKLVIETSAVVFVSYKIHNINIAPRYTNEFTTGLKSALVPSTAKLIVAIGSYICKKTMEDFKAIHEFFNGDDVVGQTDYYYDEL